MIKIAQQIRRPCFIRTRVTDVLFLPEGNQFGGLPRTQKNVSDNESRAEGESLSLFFHANRSPPRTSKHVYTRNDQKKGRE